jgi:hypothetical protein
VKLESALVSVMEPSGRLRGCEPHLLLFSSTLATTAEIHQSTGSYLFRIVRGLQSIANRGVRRPELAFVPGGADVFEPA